MALPHDLDHEKLAEVGLALLGLTAHGEYGALRAWKGLDWDLMDLLHQKGWIENPASKNKSVVLTDEGAKLVDRFLERHFGKQ